ncbi:MAG: xanthine dehydrogenase family protein molybdopterin-binding subunit [Herminiimonas sp.]|nr:xanthine dehydrogenase family protein molybdopterin-binding subunit [Herminiimonas sp.]
MTPSPDPRRPARRRFLLAALGVTGALTVGWGVLPPRQRLDGDHPLPLIDGDVALNGWIKIGRNGMVTVAMPRSEMGQGVHTALPMLVAEELDVPLSMVQIVQAPIDRIFGNVAVLPDGLPFHPDDHGMLQRTVHWLTVKTARELGIMVTGGSTSIKDAWEPMRQAGATARAMLVAAAARQWNVPVAECRAAGGIVSHASGRQAGYGALAAAAATGARPADIRPKPPQAFTLIGTPQPRRDARVKVDGSAVFGIDVRPPGLLYAALRMTPTLGGTLKPLDTKAVAAPQSMPGVVRVVDFSVAAGGVAGVAVVARTFWQAQQALAALALEWDAGPNAALTDAGVFADLAQRLDADGGHVYHARGEPAVAAPGARTVTAQYRAPFLAHAAMEPINCTAQVRDGKVTVWTGTQVPSLAVAAAAKVAQVDADAVTLHVPYLGGGFGRRLEVDMVRQAVAIAMQAGGAPVQVIWSREQDMTHDVFRPAALARFTGVLDAAGQVVGYDNRSASGSVMQHVLQRTFGFPGAGPDKSTAEGEFDLPYELANVRVSHLIVPSVVPLGYWRSVGHSHNAFFKESFIEELAHAAGKDGVAFRRSLLTQHPRHLAVLDAAVAAAGSPAPGRAHGVALHQSFGSIVAQVAEVSVDGGAIRVHKVTCAVDCGIAVNPNLIAQQMESAVTFGLSAALLGEITVAAGKIVQQNYDGYPVLRMPQAPLVETVIIRSAQPPQGIGEPGVPPVAPAVASAVFQLTGQRLRQLPLRLA